MRIANSTFGDALLAGDRPGKPAVPSTTPPPVTEIRSRAGRPGVEDATATQGGRNPQKSAASGTAADAIRQINDYLQFHGRNLKFKIDRDTGRTVVQIIDSATDEVLRQIPPQEMLDIAKRLEDAEGLLFRGDA